MRKLQLAGLATVVASGVGPWFLTLTAAAEGPRYVVTELPSLGGTLARAEGVNNAGLVVGESRRAGETYEVVTAWVLPDHHPVYVTGSGISVALGNGASEAGVVIGHMDTIGLAAFRATPGGPVVPMPELGTRMGDARAINVRGDIVGSWSSTGNSGSHPFIVHGGAFTPLPVLGGIQGKAMAVNSAGTAVGWSDGTDTYFSRAAMWQGGAVVELLSNASVCIAYGVNDRGWAVGYVSGAPSPRYVAVLWTDPQTRIDLGLLDSSPLSQIAYGINNRDQIVGTSGNRAFLWEGGVMRDLNSMIDPAAGWTLTIARAVSDSGLIVGEGTRAGQTKGFLLSPRCPADLDGSGAVTPSDLAAFVALWSASLASENHAGDFDLDGAVTPADVGMFVATWFAAHTGGC